jgi:isopentenyl phosphate kinase
MKDLYIIKVGGSVCTEKKKNLLKAKKKTIKRIVKELREAFLKKKFKAVLVHGAGPFGHKTVKDYNINNGLRNSKDFEGFIKTNSRCAFLNSVFVRELEKQGFLAVGIHPMSCIIQKNKKIVEFNLKIIKKLLELNNGIIPVLYGTMVIDESLNGSVVSGDTITCFLAKKLKAKKVFFGTDVEGVFKGTKIVKVINNNNWREIKKALKESKSIDVTKGMLGKIMEIRKNIKGIPVKIFNLNKKGNLKALLLGEKSIGTKIFFKK